MAVRPPRLGTAFRFRAHRTAVGPERLLRASLATGLNAVHWRPAQLWQLVCTHARDMRGEPARSIEHLEVQRRGLLRKIGATARWPLAAGADELCALSEHAAYLLRVDRGDATAVLLGAGALPVSAVETCRQLQQLLDAPPMDRAALGIAPLPSLVSRFMPEALLAAAAVLVLRRQLAGVDVVCCCGQATRCHALQADVVRRGWANVREFSVRLVGDYIAKPLQQIYKTVRYDSSEFAVQSSASLASDLESLVCVRGGWCC